MKKSRVSPSLHISKPPIADDLTGGQTAPQAVVQDDGRDGRTNFRDYWRRLDGSLIGMILAVKAVIFIFGVQSYLTWMNNPIGSWYGCLEIWNRWDSLRHIRLAQIGYTGAGSNRADLFGYPLFPWLARLLAFVFHDHLISKFVMGHWAF